jgi:hypothetical protein
MAKKTKASNKKRKGGPHNAPKGYDWDDMLLKQKLHKQFPSRAAFARFVGVSSTAVRSAMRARDLA